VKPKKNPNSYSLLHFFYLQVVSHLNGARLAKVVECFICLSKNLGFPLYPENIKLQDKRHLPKEIKNYVYSYLN
jgi:hypothetical protein